MAKERENGRRLHAGRWVAVACLLLCGALAAQRTSWTDSIGAKIELTDVPQRVVSLAPSLTEEIFAVGAGGQLVGDTNYCVHPAAARLKTKIGSIQKPSIEIILGLHPDLVLATQDGNSESTVVQLRQLGIQVYTFGPSRSYADVRQSYRTLGELLGHRQKAQQQLAQVDRALGAIHGQLAGKTPLRVFLQLGPGSLYTVNGQTFLSDVLAHAGAVNVMASLPVRYPQVDRESVLKANPDAIVVTADVATADRAAVEAGWQGFPQIAAVRERRIFALDQDIVDTPTPQNFLASVCAVDRHLYPGLPLPCGRPGSR